MRKPNEHLSRDVSNSWKDNISFVLVEPKDPGNIGASARAMKNMGFAKLELVNPGAFLTQEARQMAYNSIDVLETATIHSGFKDAIKDKNLIVGTTRRVGRKRGLIIPLKESVKRIITAAKKNKVALVFGRERNGLTNQEIEQCSLLISIPSDPLCPSLNLSQSLLLVAYELGQKTYKTEVPPLVRNEELATLYKHIQSTLRLLEYIPKGNKDLETKIIKNLKHIIGRAGLADWELKMAYGLMGQVKKKLDLEQR